MMSFARNIPFFSLLLLVFSVIHSVSFASDEHHHAIHHQLVVQPDLDTGKLTIQDTISLKKQHIDATNMFTFQLHKRFTVSVITHDADHNKQLLTPLRTQANINSYRIPIKPTQQTLTLHYTGQIASTPQCQFTQQTCVLLNKKGVYLSPAAAWYANTTSGLHTFSMTVEQLPAEWRSLSQGQEKERHQWHIDKPQDGIYLVAAAFKVYEKKGEIAKAQVYLLNDDAALAQRYLNATEKYLRYYQMQLGSSYPYSKFATVESFWESGWGMPSFTLLGSRVMRMPFILYTSFPHEILHNWWGNSVYIDASSGNWAEGLTAYLADHGLKVKTDKDAAYRRAALSKYAAFTQEGNDFPISQFRSRHNNATQAVGYSKLLMVYRMLHDQVGDAEFFVALKQFYRDYQYQYASMDDLIASLSKTMQRDLTPFFNQWVMQTDAPQLRIKHWQRKAKDQDDANMMVTLQLQQVSSQKPFLLNIPIFAFNGEKPILKKTLTLDSEEKTFVLQLPARATRLAIDPFFNVLRKPLADEIPANLYAFTDPRKKQIRYADKPLWWADIAKQLSETKPDTLQLADKNNDDHQVVVQLGNAQQSKNAQLIISPTRYQVGEISFARSLHSLVFVEKQGQKTVITIDAPQAKQAQTVLRKLRHYGKYSYLIFNQEGKNMVKGEWQVTQSPLMINLLH